MIIVQAKWILCFVFKYTVGAVRELCDLNASKRRHSPQKPEQY